MIPIPSIQAQLRRDADLGSYHVKYAKCIYDVAVDGGAISVITPKDNCVIPSGAIILGGVFDTLTSFVGTSGTIAVGTSAGSAADSILAAAAITVFTGVAAVMIPKYTAATIFKMTADGRITVTVATTVLTAGKLGINVLWIQGD